jgi:Zn-dependent protease
MIPIPPLDGFRLVKIISNDFAMKVERYSTYIALGLVVLIIF